MKTLSYIAKSLHFAVTITCFIMPLPVQSQTAEPTQTGKQITFSQNKGNCLACHAIEDGAQPGNIGPALKNIRKKFSDKQHLREFIWDSRKYNKGTIMPPYGQHEILTEEEIDQVTEYVYSL